MVNRVFHIIGIVAVITLIIACFIPWTHYNNINETFTGFNVKKFSTGNYYGKAGIVITVMAVLVLLFMLLQRTWAKRVNLFLSAILAAYCIRTYIIFTSALFPGEVDKLAGIYLVAILPFIILASTVFPYMGKKEL